MRLARAGRAQVIHSHGKGAGLYGRIAARLTGAAAIHTFHGIHHAGYSRLYLTLERALARRSYAVIHVSASQAEEARALGLAPPGRTHVIVNGVDTAAVRALAAGRDPDARRRSGSGRTPWCWRRWPASTRSRASTCSCARCRSWPRECPRPSS